MLHLLLLLPVHSHGSPETSFVRSTGKNFVLNGRLLHVNGFNSYWLMWVASDTDQRHKVTSAFKEAADHGLNVARTWAFNDGNGYHALQTSPGVYDEQVFQRIMTRNNSLNGVVYKDDPTIFAWELINEPRCQIDPSGRTVQRWVKEMASYVKSIDSNHLLEVGMEGFYGDSVPIRKQFNPNGLEFGTDFITINQLPGIDFATVHAYPDSWLAGSDDKVQLLFLKKWMKVHIKDATKVLKKPILFAEFGKSYKDPGYNISERNKFYKTVYENIYKAAKTGKVGGGGLFWQLVAEGMESLADGYEIVLSQNPSTAALVSFQSRRLSALDL
ncbi:hypothetical protein SUGI_0342820 [Cryptomeria japonica]|nr:hypothetical protein SUGI_0342820 [Cryptomeria japonica]